MTKKERFEAVLDFFRKNNPEAETELHYENPYQLLVAVLLSAQCTDKRINMVTPNLFAKFPTPEHLAASHFDEVFPIIKSVTYPNNKAKHLIKMAKILAEEFNSVVPSDIKDLQKMPGVGRKTANVIASVVYNQPTMAVDTHVFRVSKRIGLATQISKTPLEVEKQLIRYIPKKDVPLAHHWLILHGRYTCIARKPKCEECEISQWCKYYETGMAGANNEH